MVDSEVVRAAQAGDVTRLGSVLVEHQGSMEAAALSVLGYRVDVSDVVQDAMVVAALRIADLRDPAKIGPWLRAIVRNNCRMLVRNSARLQPVDPWELASRADARVPAGEAGEGDESERDEWLWQAVHRLSEPLQLVVLLRHFTEVRSYEAIADICGIPIGTVRSRLNSAHRRLQESLSSDPSGVDPSDLGDLRRREHEIVTLITAAEQGDIRSYLAGVTSSELRLVGPGGEHGMGRELLASVMESDLEAGVRQHVMRVRASSRCAVMECQLVSPPDDPEHCPPAVAWLLTYGEGFIERVRLFHPQ